MNIHIHAKPKAKKAYVKKIDSLHYVVSVNEPPIGGRANKAIIDALSGYFDIPKSQISIVQGEHDRKKVIEIPEHTTAPQTELL